MISYSHNDYLFGMVMPKATGDSLLFSSGFDSGLDGWSVYNAGTVANDNGRLKFSGTVPWSTVKKPLTLKTGKQYRVRFTIDMGNCSDLHVPVYKSDITSYEVLTGIGISVTASGTYEGTFTAANNSMLLLFEMIPGANPPPDSTGYYWLDDVSVEEVKPVESTVVENGEYRYLFNGKELDKETSATTTYDYGFRIYSPAIGKFLSLDPLQKKYPGESNYIFTSDNPTIIGKDGKSFIKRTTKKDFFIYSENEVPGFFNSNHFYKSDLNVNVTIDYRGEKGQITFSSYESNQREISRGDFRLHQLGNFMANLSKPNEERGSQPSGLTFTSEFTTNGDGPKTDATKSSQGNINIDGKLAVFNAVKMSPETPKFIIDDLPEWATLAKDLSEQTFQDKIDHLNERTTKICPDCRAGDRYPDYGADVYILNDKDQVIDTLQRNPKTGKVDTLNGKKRKR